LKPVGRHDSVWSSMNNISRFPKWMSEHAGAGVKVVVSGMRGKEVMVNGVYVGVVLVDVEVLEEVVVFGVETSPIVTASLWYQCYWGWTQNEAEFGRGRTATGYMAGSPAPGP
jgi:hypothetical protein